MPQADLGLGMGVWIHTHPSIHTHPPIHIHPHSHSQIVETTIENDNSHLVRKFVKPDTMLTWARSMLATRLATSGADWTEISLRHNLLCAFFTQKS